MCKHQQCHYALHSVKSVHWQVSNARITWSTCGLEYHSPVLKLASFSGCIVRSLEQVQSLLRGTEFDANAMEQSGVPAATLDIHHACLGAVVAVCDDTEAGKDLPSAKGREPTLLCRSSDACPAVLLNVSHTSALALQEWLMAWACPATDTQRSSTAVG